MVLEVHQRLIFDEHRLAVQKVYKARMMSIEHVLNPCPSLVHASAEGCLASDGWLIN